ncbi:AMP-binding protein [Actibacterium pelagium]|uniref:AMP-dependent synthetase/ligase domain-containing protein n=1 Tax=Actibacterium pelagium TaxID=2029103 RepID=A0A917EN32_9RHOB|nr:class I adenylate-forming enzyme family protein [Actibacterium pelagium]GGE59090.1 hypothetical protein GCM10011517_28510 [Actibacterium pelagium]
MRLYELFYKSAEKRPEKTALFTENSQLSYRDLLQLVVAIDRALKDRGVKSGQTLLIDTDRGDLCIAFALLLSLRGYGVIYAGEGASYIDDTLYDHWVSVRPTAPKTSKLILVEGDWFKDLHQLTPITPAEISPEPGTFIGTTSGSTGQSKLVASPEEERISQVMRFRGVQAADAHKQRWASRMKPDNGWAMNSYLGILCAGGSVVALGAEQDRLLPFIDHYAVSYLVASPLLIQQMLNVENPGQYLSSLRNVVLGGAYTSNQMLTELRKHTDATIEIGFGAAEIGGIAVARYDLDTPFEEGFVGEVYRDDIEVRFFDEDLNPLPEANEGVVGFSRKSMTGAYSYYGQEQSDGKTGFLDGVFFSGDIMRMEGKKLYILGRTKNVINLGGNKISLESVQRRLESSFPGANFAAMAVSAANEMEELAICYVANSEISVEAINQVTESLFTNLSTTKVLRLADFPLTESGKVDIETLKGRPELQ